MNFKKKSLLTHISIISVLVIFGIGFFCFSLIFSSKEPHNPNPEEANETYTTPADKLQSPMPKKQSGKQEVSSQKIEERSEYQDASAHSTTLEEKDADISLEASSIHDETLEKDEFYLEETERYVEESQPIVEKQETYPVGDLRRLTSEERQHYEQLTAELQAVIRKQPKTIEERKEREKEHIRRLVELHNKLKPYYKKLGFPEPPEGW